MPEFVKKHHVQAKVEVELELEQHVMMELEVELEVEYLHVDNIVLVVHGTRKPRNS